MFDIEVPDIEAQAAGSVLASAAVQTKLGAGEAAVVIPKSKTASPE